MSVILPLNNLSFCAFANKKTNSNNAKSEKSMKNPISKSGERLKLASAVFIAGLGFGVKMLAEVFDSDFVVEHLEKKGRKIANKNYKNASKNKREAMAVLSSLGIIGIFIGACAFLYTLFKTPKIMYEGKVNAFTKTKDMDVYIKGNSIEKELLTQMNEKAKISNDEEKQKLKTQYMQMQIAKNQLPDFIKDDKSFNLK